MNKHDPVRNRRRKKSWEKKEGSPGPKDDPVREDDWKEIRRLAAGERPAADAPARDAFDGLLDELDPVSLGAENPVVPLGGSSIRDEDWEAIRKLSAEHPATREEDPLAPWTPRTRASENPRSSVRTPSPPTAQARPATPPRRRRRAQASQYLPGGKPYIPRGKDYIPRGEDYISPGRRARAGSRLLVAAAIGIAIIASAYLGILLGNAFFPR